MFVILVSYKKPISEVDKYLKEHREFLDQCYSRNQFLASGPQLPRNGGVIVSHLKSRRDLEDLLAQDPFAQHAIADYQIIEFDPIKYHRQLSNLLD
jgi:uncharacterized protein YciI